ncbi:MAG: hypothetical protein M3007_01185 [Candidatus Eremiobacteraeota bacterium]|nr:hypothetical protein [Candidatus Eremiobacteraeota bacterium]
MSTVPTGGSNAGRLGIIAGILGGGILIVVGWNKWFPPPLPTPSAAPNGSPVTRPIGNVVDPPQPVGNLSLLLAGMKGTEKGMSVIIKVGSAAMSLAPCTSDNGLSRNLGGDRWQCDYSQEIPLGSTITLTAQSPPHRSPAAVIAAGPAPDILFEGFNGAACAGGNPVECTFLLQHPTGISATFKHLPVVSIVVNRPTGTGVAVVMNDPNSVSAECDVCDPNVVGINDRCTPAAPCHATMPEGLRPTITAWGGNGHLKKFGGACADQGTLFCQLPPLVDDVAVSIDVGQDQLCKVSGVQNFGPCDFPAQFKNGDNLHFGLAVTQGCKGACAVAQGYRPRQYPALY